jgi:hypothetical protein
MISGQVWPFDIGDGGDRRAAVSLAWTMAMLAAGTSPTLQ